MIFKKAYTNNGRTCDEFTVFFTDGSIYGMSSNANMPNGFCQFVGDAEDFELHDEETIEFNQLPIGTKKQISNLEKWDFDGNSNVMEFDNNKENKK